MFRTNRVDIALDEVVLFWLQDQVVPPERHNPGLWAAARDLGQAVRVQASAGQDVAASHLPALVVQHTHCFKIIMLSFSL